MSNSIHLEVLTPDKQALSLEVSSVYLQGSQGRMGLLPGHTALIARLDFGFLDYQGAGEEGRMLCGSGTVEVQDNKITVLVKSAEKQEDIDEDRAKDALARAKSRRDSKDKDVDMLRAEAALYRAIERLKYIGKM